MSTQTHEEPQDVAAKPLPHPFDQLSAEEINCAREIVLQARGRHAIQFRSIFTEEPRKADLVPFLEAEHSGQLTLRTKRPARLARIHYDVIQDDKTHDYTESVVDVEAGKEVLYRVVDKKHQPALTLCVSPR
jgi:primary-amine oxidase